MHWSGTGLQSTSPPGMFASSNKAPSYRETFNSWTAPDEHKVAATPCLRYAVSAEEIVTPELPKNKRDAHLFGPGPKRILSLDGGGVRGAATIAFLERLEQQIGEVEGRPTLLCDWFDLIGG